MSSRKNAQDSSLELLLDTICNTFGGVLFISILVVVLLSTTSEQVAHEPPDDASQARLKALYQQLEESKSEVERLQSIVQRQQELSKQLAGADVESLVKNLLEVEKEFTQLDSDKKSKLTKISSAQIEVNDIASEIKRGKDQVQQARRELDEVERLLRTEIATRTRSFKLPRERRTTKKEVAFLLSGGRLHGVVMPTPGGGVARNTTETNVIKDEKGISRVVPKPGTGVSVANASAASDAVASKLGAFDKDAYYVALAVWPDSFEQFHAIKQAMVSMGIEYRLIPMPDDKGVPIGGRPGGGAAVQ